MVCKVLCKYYESNGDVCKSDRSEVRKAHVAESAECLNEGKFRNREEALCRNSVSEQISKAREIDNLDRVTACCHSDECKNSRKSITAEDTDDEGYKLGSLLSENRSKHRSEKCYKSAKNGDEGMSSRRRALELSHSTSGEAETDDRNRGSDNRCGHELADPLNT